MKRKEVRQSFMQMLFQMDAQQDYSGKAKQQFIELNLKEEAPDQYFDRLYEIIRDYRQEIDELIESTSDKWKVNRMAKVDIAIIRLCVGELLYMDDVPDSASINEAVELAKKFGGEDSAKFVNGVLGKIFKTKEQGKKQS